MVTESVSQFRTGAHENGRHVFYSVCTLPVSAGESLILMEETNKFLRRNLVSNRMESGEGENQCWEHAVLAVTPSVLPTALPNEEDGFERGWQLSGESRVLKIECSTDLAMRNVHRWLLSGKFNRIVMKGTTQVRRVRDICEAMRGEMRV
jgi:hypothetical protein